MAKAMLIQGSFETSQPIMVMRDGKELTLPASAAPAVSNAPAPTPTASANQSPTPTPAAPPQQPHNIWEQANQIKDAAGK
jgi:hypothetical protein